MVRYPFGNQKASGMSWWLPGLLPLFFINADMPGDHQRFTLLHELGHVALHRIPSETIEDEANRFAAELLPAVVGPCLRADPQPSVTRNL
jgi:Zn-dependent peptidase ImmA (M78 family)